MTTPIENQKAAEQDTQSESTTTSLNAQDATVKIAQNEASCSDGSSGVQQNRRLKRLARTSGKSRFARLSEDRRQEKRAQEKNRSIRKPEDFIGVELADGRYKVVSRLGKGSMAYVLLATDSRLETEVVVKIPKPEKLAGDEIRERFRRESQLLVRLAHPHVVKVLDVGEYQQVPYVVMQLLSGGTLTDKMDAAGKSRQLPPEFLKQWVREVARALDFCAKQGTVHRDVKPANILFDTDDNAYVSDFGLTKIMYGEHTTLNSSETTTGVVLGTPNYIAPEIVLGNAYDGRADQYSLGITVYHTLLGRAPMQGNSATVTMINQTQKQLQLLSDVRSDVPRELALVIRRSIEKDPQKRFGSCEEFAEAAIDALRASSASSVSAIAPSPASLIPQSPSSASISSEKRKRKKNSLTESSNASSRRKRTPTGTEAAAFENYLTGGDFISEDEDWLANPVSTPPPKKRGSSKSSKTTQSPKKRKPSNQNRVVVFGRNVHPAVLIGGGLFSILLLILRISTLSSDASAPTPGNTSQVAAGNESNSQKTRPATGQTKNSATQTATATLEKKPKVAESNGPQGSNTTDKTQPPAKKSTPVASNAPVTRVSSSKKVVDAQATSTMKPKSPTVPKSPAQVFDTVPFAASERVTVGLPSQPVIVCGSRVWDKVSRKTQAQLGGSYLADAYTTLSPDGRLFAAASKSADQQNNAVTVWNTQTGEEIFTAAGDSERYADVILLSSDTLFVGDRWSDELLTWNCQTGKKSRSIRIPDAKFKQGNVAISNDGQYLAAIARGRMLAVNTNNGQPAGLMANPDEMPIAKRSPMSDAEIKVDLRRQATAEAEPIFAAMQSLHFSPDNQQLAGFSNYPRTRVICWNNVGHIVADHAAFTKYNHPGYDAALQWFETHNAWLVSDRVILREQGHVVLTAFNGSQTSTHLHIYDDQHLIGALSSGATESCLLPIPWNEIQTCLKDMEERPGDAILSPGSTVSLQLNLAPRIAPKTPESADLYKSFRQNVTRSGLKVDNNQSLLFRIRIASGQETLPVVSRLQPIDWRVPSSSPSSATTEYLVAELLSNGDDNQLPLWRIPLGSVPELSSDDGRSLIVDDVRGRIESVVFPYFIPQNEAAMGLPVSIF